MLNIILDGMRAVIKKNISFEFVAENRRFSKSDSYTLEIAFPIKDCRENIEIFGDLSRKDMSPKSMKFECEIIDNSFHKKGSAIITEFSESEVKCQFLEGRSGSDLSSPIADTFINEIAISSPSSQKSAISPTQAWQASRDCVALPWVNNESGNIQNKISFEDGAYIWHTDTVGLSWFPYLTTVIKKICEAIGYSYDISDIESNEAIKYLLVCNALPATWYVPDVARALPHWTVEEFFSKLEDFLFGEFLIDHTNKSITYQSPEEISEGKKMVEITSDINDFTAEVFIKDSECSAIEAVNVKYKKSNHSLQKFYDCNEAVKRLRESGMTIEFETLQDLVDQIDNEFWLTQSGHRNLNLSKLYYIKQDKRYFCAQCFYTDSDKRKIMGLQNVNDFGERIIDESKSAKSVEIEFVPACIDYTDTTYGFTLFCAPGSFNESSENSYQTAEESIGSAGIPEGEEGNKRGAGGAVEVINIEQLNVEKSEYYDRIYLGWWNGQIQFNGLNPFPNVADVLAVGIHAIKRYPFCLSLKSERSPMSMYAEDIDTSVRYNIQFLSDSLPSANSIFLIKGKKYVCEKLTTSFTERGMSSLIKGVFWRLNS